MSREVDQQWVATEKEADELRDALAPAAAKKGYVVGKKKLSGRNGGYLITVIDPDG